MSMTDKVINNVWADDALNHKVYADTLDKHVERACKLGTWLALNGEWGSGKTFVLDRWQKEYNKKSLSLLIDAARDDHMENNPLLSIIGQLHFSIKGEWINEIKKSWQSSLLKIGENIAEHFSRIDVEKLKPVSINAFNSYLAEKETEKYLYDRLTEIADTIHKETDFPLVVIIDNLDRCAPTFSVRLMERIKFLDSIKGLVVLWGVNCKELEKSLCSIYGDIYSDDYLRKFWQISIDMPQISGLKYCAHLFNKHQISHSSLTENHKAYSNPGGYIDDEFEIDNWWEHNNRHVIENVWINGWKDMITHFPYLVSCLNLTLRQIEEAVNLFDFVLRDACRPKHFWVGVFHPSIMVYLILLKIVNKKMYNDFIFGRVNGDNVLSYFIYKISNQHHDFNSIHDYNNKKFQLIKQYAIFSFLNNCSQEVRSVILKSLLDNEEWDSLLLCEPLKQIHPYIINMIEDKSDRTFLDDRLTIIKENLSKRFSPYTMNSLLNRGNDTDDYY